MTSPTGSRVVRTLRTMRINWIGIAFLALLILLWQAAVDWKWIHIQFFASPTDVAKALRRMAADGRLGHSVWHTVFVTIIGWLIASAIGIVLGVCVGLSRLASRFTLASLEVMRAIPGITLAPLAVLLFKYSIKTELFLVVFVAVWPVLVSTVDGIRASDFSRLEMAYSLRMKRLAVITKIMIPESFASIFVGLRISLSVAFALSIVAEIVGNPEGIGNALVRAQEGLQAGEMFAFVAVSGIIGVLLNALLTIGFRLAFPGIVAAAEER